MALARIENMAFPSVVKTSHELGMKTFTRVVNETGLSRYKDVASVDSPTILENDLLIRTTEKGSPRDPLTHKRTLNMSRVMSVNVVGSGVYTGSVNLTVTIPGGSVIDSTALKSMVGDLLALAVDLENAGTNAGSVLDQAISPAYALAAKLLQTE
jgi:hypothetical protein